MYVQLSAWKGTFGLQCAYFLYPLSLTANDFIIYFKLNYISLFSHADNEGIATTNIKNQFTANLREW
jgi:hypothetical protein